MNHFCTTCGATRTDAERFCLQCGSQLDDEQREQHSARRAAQTPLSHTWRGPTIALAGAAVMALIAFAAFQAVHPGDSDSTSDSKAIAFAGAAHPTTTGPAPTPPTTSDSAQVAAVAAAKKLAVQKSQAGDVAAIVRQSAKARTKVVQAVALVRTCRDTTAGTTLLNQAIAGRAAVLGLLATVKVSALPNGAAMVGNLAQAQRESLRADEAFLRWAQSASYSCTYYSSADQDDSYNAGVAASAAAQAAKRKFVNRWTPIAELTGLQKYSTADI